MADSKYAHGLASDGADQLTVLSVNCRDTPHMRKHLQTTFSIFRKLANHESSDADLTLKQIKALYDELNNHWRVQRKPFKIVNGPLRSLKMSLASLEEFIRNQWICSWFINNILLEKKRRRDSIAT